MHRLEIGMESSMEAPIALLREYGLGAVIFFASIAFAVGTLRIFAKSAVQEGVKIGFSKEMAKYQSGLQTDLERIKVEFAKGIEQYKADLQIESERLKSSLAKSHTVFTLQLEALTVLRRVFRGILPKKKHREMEWEDACEDIALSFLKHANDLDEFLALHSAALPNDVLQSVETAISIATEGQFELRWTNPPEPTAAAIDAADKFWDTVHTAVIGLQRTVDAQIGQRRSPS